MSCAATVQEAVLRIRQELAEARGGQATAGHAHQAAPTCELLRACVRACLELERPPGGVAGGGMRTALLVRQAGMSQRASDSTVLGDVGGPLCMLPSVRLTRPDPVASRNCRRPFHEVLHERQR